MAAHKAFATYQSYRDRLPQLRRTNIKPQKINSILDIADDFDTFFFDAFGVLNVGKQALGTAVDVVNQLIKQGKQCFVVSNAAGFEKSRQITKFANLGFNFDSQHIITSRDALLEDLKKYPKDMIWGSIAPADGQNDLAEMGIQTIHQNEADFLKADGFLFLYSLLWNEDRQKQWIDALLQYPRPILLGNPDIIAPQGEHISIESGHYIFSLKQDLFAHTCLFGKPFPGIYQVAKKRVIESYGRFNNDRTLMIGDTLHTDILGGNAFGIKTALVTAHGFFKNLAVQSYIQQSQIHPDYLLENI